MTVKYYPFSRFLKDRFGVPVYKLPLDAGFSCPNRDGTLGRGGCTFCHNPSFGPFAHQPLPLEEQMELTMARLRRRHRGQIRYLSYLQNYTGTYGPVAQLKQIYDTALSHPEVVGLAVGTRPDCVPDPVLALIESYALNYHVWLEYGLQTIHDRTLERINRGHTAEQFRDAVSRTKGRGIFICAHVILGLPGETTLEAVATARALTALGVDGVKLHHLQVINGTPLADEWRAGTLDLLTPSDYVSWVCDFLEHLDPGITIHRLVGETLHGEMLLAPQWNLSKIEILTEIDREFERRGTAQGARLHSK